jgi:hypothetical protein
MRESEMVLMRESEMVLMRESEMVLMRESEMAGTPYATTTALTQAWPR